MSDGQSFSLFPYGNGACPSWGLVLPWTAIVQLHWYHLFITQNLSEGPVQCHELWTPHQQAPTDPCCLYGSSLLIHAGMGWSTVLSSIRGCSAQVQENPRDWLLSECSLPLKQPLNKSKLRASSAAPRSWPSPGKAKTSRQAALRKKAPKLLTSLLGS